MSIFSLILLVAAGLIGKSMWRLIQVNPGFKSEQLLTVQFNLFFDRYQDDQRRRLFFDQLLEGIQGLPGVLAAGTVTELPLSGSENDTRFSIEGRSISPNEADALNANQRVVSPDYFRAMGIPVLEGRGFTQGDGVNNPLVIVISQSLAQRLWVLRLDYGAPWLSAVSSRTSCSTSARPIR